MSRKSILLNGAVSKRFLGPVIHIFRYLRLYRHYYTNKKTVLVVIHYSYKLLLQRLYDIRKEHVVETNGYKLKTMANDVGISLELLIFKTHEPLTTRLLHDEIEKGMVCIDIGGNIGYYTISKANW